MVDCHAHLGSTSTTTSTSPTSTASSAAAPLEPSAPLTPFNLSSLNEHTAEDIFFFDQNPSSPSASLHPLLAPSGPLTQSPSASASASSIGGSSLPSSGSSSPSHPVKAFQPRGENSQPSFDLSFDPGLFHDERCSSAFSGLDDAVADATTSSSGSAVEPPHLSAILDELGFNSLVDPLIDFAAAPPPVSVKEGPHGCLEYTAMAGFNSKPSGHGCGRAGARTPAGSKVRPRTADDANDANDGAAPTSTDDASASATPSKKRKKVAEPAPTGATPANALPSSSAASPSVPVQFLPGDSPETKRLKRMQKNRESAMVSRQRKKAYIAGLEADVKRLELQRDAMQVRINELTAENTRLKEHIGPKAAPELVKDARGPAGKPAASAARLSNVGGTMLLAALLCCGIFVDPAGVTLGDSAIHHQHQQQQQQGLGFTGRRLLSSSFIVPTMSDVAGYPLHPKNPVVARVHATAPRPPSSAMALHKPPSRVLKIDSGSVSPTANTWDTWLMQQQAKVLAGQNHSAIDGAAAPKAPSSSSTTELGSLVAEHERSLADLTLRLDESARPSIVRTLRRRTDTSYVFCSEVTIISATTKNKDDARPKMAVVMPSVTEKALGNDSNATVPDMLEIDCEVLGTKVLTPESFMYNM